MSNEPSLREQLSALADGELAPDQARFLLRRIDAEPALAAEWQRLHLARACLRRERIALPDVGFADAVAARIRAEAAPAALGGWRRTALGGAIAAGMAALALFAVAPRTDVAPTAAPVLAEVAPLDTRDLALRAAPGELQRASDRTWSPLPVAAPFDLRVESYFLRHGGAATAAPRGGFVPYVNVVATPAAAPPIPLRDPQSQGEAARR
ncbi:MAG: sigma-E factor negative regulatory protein [Xanthomonadaceae bacterium]|jgi:anti-sigma factor RsiW|nr:sigma-E factor negative regulatory protein [Xanthomonadaceae bacterium]